MFKYTFIFCIQWATQMIIWSLLNIFFNCVDFLIQIATSREMEAFNKNIIDQVL